MKTKNGPGGDAPLVYSLSPAPPAGLTFAPATRVLSGTPAAPSSGSYTYTVTDADGDAAELTFTIVVVADNMPSFQGLVGDQSYVENQAITPVALPEAVGGDAPLVYSLSPAPPAGLTFAPATRVLSGTPAAPSSGSYTYTVTDADGDAAELTFTIVVVADNMPSFQGLVGDQSYVENQAITPVALPEAVGGDAPLDYSLSPAPPAGLTFAPATRVLSGTPAAPSSGSYTYTVTDADGDAAELTFTIVVVADNMPSFQGLVGDQSYVENQAITPVALPEAVGGDAPLDYSLSPAPPAGLTFAPATRELSGTPAAPSAERTYTYTVTDADGDAAELTFTIVVVADNMPSLQGLVGDQSYVENQAITPVALPEAEGGDAPLVYSLSPAPPAGLTFAPATRELSGTPAAPSAERTYTYTVTDADGDAAELTFTIVVVADNMPSFRGLVGDQSYVENQAITPVALPEAVGGDAPLDYSLSPAPPAGLTFAPATRELSGTPAAPSAERTYTYTVTDADGDAAELTFTIVVEEGLIEEQAAIEETVKAVTAATAANIAANIGTRFAAARSGSTVVVGGQPVKFGSVPNSTFISAATDRDEYPFDAYSPVSHSRSLGVDELLRSSAFEISLNAADDEAQGAAMAPQWTIWGRGDLQFFESLPERGSTYDGSLKAGYLGIDGRSSDQWLFGLAASLTNTEADYGLGDGSGGEGRLDVSIAGLHPYLRYSPDDTNEFWAILGLGQGEITNERAGSAEREASDIDMRMAAAGARRNLVSDKEWNLALLGDVGIAQIETEDGVQAIQGLSVDTWRGRLGVEGSYTTLLESGYAVTTFAEVAGRYDGGEGEDEMGLEISPGVYLAGPNGFGIEVRGRMLALHTAENYEEYGASMTLSMSPRPDGSGLSLSLAPRVGGETGGADTLWREDPFALSGVRSAKREALSLNAGMGYGIKAKNGLLTPFGEFNLSNEASRRLRAGARFSLMRSSLGKLSLELSGERHELEGADPEHRVGVTGRLRF